MASKFRIGVFDSGIGGLTVLHECDRVTTGCRYYYYGDNVRAPYGSKPREEILGYVRGAMRVFERLDVDAVVLACNTATAVCAETLRKEFAFPIIGTEPAILPAARMCRSALVLATPRTAESARLQELIRANTRCRFTVHAAEGLARAIERKLTMGENFNLKEHLPKGDFEGVVLGCTHYVFLKKEIAEFYRLPIFDGNAGVARRLRSLLDEKSTEMRSALKNIGITDHFKGKMTMNKRLQKFTCLYTKNRIFFLNVTKKCNKFTYKQTFV